MTWQWESEGEMDEVTKLRCKKCGLTVISSSGEFFGCPNCGNHFYEPLIHDGELPLWQQWMIAAIVFVLSVALAYVLFWKGG